MASFKEYDADQVTVLFGAVLVDSGYGDGEFVRIEQAEKSFGTKVGTDGEVTRYKMNNRVTTVTIITSQSSSANARFSAILAADEAGPNGAGVAPLKIRDRQGSSNFEAQFAWITGPPKQVYGREPTDREWELECIRDVNLAGGN